MNPRPKKKMLDRRFVDTDVYTLAIERTRRVFELFDHVAVSFSGGKDSTAVLNVALDVARELGRVPLRVIFFDEEAIPYETEEYVRRVFADPDVAGEWYCLPQRHRNACSRQSPWWWPWAPEARDLWVRPMPPEAITSLQGFPMEPPMERMTAPDMNGLLFDPSLGSCAMLMGIRAAESLTRLRAVTRKKDENYLVAYSGMTDRGNVTKAYPIFDWRDTDVWTAPAKFGWDYNRAYNLLEMAGLSIHHQRCSPAFGEEPLQKLWTYAHCFPAVWDRMLDRVPGVGSAARYALTELYSYHDRPAKPEGMRWGAFLVHYLQRFRPEDSRVIAERLKDLIRVHYSKTSDPMVVDAPHPDTGTSWNFLLMIAMRGDFKGRKQAGGRVNTKQMERAWAKYRAELDTYRQAGTLDELRP